jgi:hypothetical protein
MVIYGRLKEDISNEQKGSKKQEQQQAAGSKQQHSDSSATAEIAIKATIALVYSC